MFFSYLGNIIKLSQFMTSIYIYIHCSIYLFIQITTNLSNYIFQSSAVVHKCSETLALFYLSANEFTVTNLEN